MSQAPAKTPSKLSARQRRQMGILGVLSAVLLVTIVVQFSGGDEQQAQALAQAGPPAEEASSAEAEGDDALSARDTRNPVLSASVPEEGLARNPFRSFWTSDEQDASLAGTEAPRLSLEGTMVSGRAAAALLDGEIHFAGDQVGGWEIVEVRSRAVLMRSPAGETITLEMPLPQVGESR